jgi:hypothetical protein
MIEAIRADHTVEAHVRVAHYADWIRAQAALIEDGLLLARRVRGVNISPSVSPATRSACWVARARWTSKERV